MTPPRLDYTRVMRSAWLFLVLTACSGSAPATGEPPTNAPAAEAPAAARRPVAELSLDELAAELRALRAIPGHFGGGDWNDDVDRFGGRKHEVLVELGERLGDGTHREAELLALGAPDEVVARGSPAWVPIYDDGARVPFDRVLVYEWRGGHDFLFFRLAGDAIVGHAWWSALE